MTTNATDKLADLALQREVEAFLFDEAALLDEWSLDEWLGLFTDDARYVVPATDMRDGDLREILAIINDDLARLSARAERLKKPSRPSRVSMAAHPPPHH